MGSLRDTPVVSWWAGHARGGDQEQGNQLRGVLGEAQDQRAVAR